MVYIVMGVAGSGKTTIGKLLAGRLKLPFHDADDHHPAENVTRMRRGIPLTDEDRAPWLLALRDGIREWNAAGGAVLACSALKKRYRQILSDDGTEEVVFVHLFGAPALIAGRLQQRREHYFSAALLQSQFEALEVPADAVTVEVNASPEEVCDKIMEELFARGLDRKR